MKQAIKTIIITLLLSVFLLSLSAFANNRLVKVGLFYSSTALKDSVNISLPVGFFSGTYSDDAGFSGNANFDTESITLFKNQDGLLSIKDSKSGNILVTAQTAKEPLYIYPYCAEGNVPYTEINGKKYPQTMEFIIDSNGNIKVINIVELEQYIKGVLPNEVYTSWEPECLKAAAIATRTYTLRNMNGKHASLGFDLCNTICCQVYEGLTKTANSTDSAVDETRGLVVKYNGAYADTVYHSLSGGITESAYGAWGGNPDAYPYLTVVETPFEDYELLPNYGVWKSFVSPSELLDYINTTSWKGKISGEISSIKYDTEGGGYIHNMTITDNSGNSVKLTNSSYVRSAFSKFVKSANFTIGKTFIPSDEKANSITIMTSSGKQTQTTDSGYTYLTSDGRQKTYGLSETYVIDGKGFGHGVGMSQYGAHFAAKQGYTAQQILQTYYPGTTIEQMN